MFDPALVLQNRTFLGVKNPLLVLAHALLAFANDRDPSQGLTINHISECVLSLCERSYITLVSSGTPLSVIVNTNWGTIEVFNAATNRTVYVYNGTTPALQTKPGKVQTAALEVYWLPNAGEVDGVRLPYLYHENDRKHWATGIMSIWDPAISSRIIGRREIIENYAHKGWYGLHASPIDYSSDAARRIVTNGLDTIVGNIAASLT
jgi:hypothetical protein